MNQPEERKDPEPRANLSASLAAKKVNGKQSLYAAMIANGYFLPGMGTSICTMTFMAAIRAGKLFCPKLKDVTFLPCAYPPSADYLRNTIIDMIDNPTSVYDNEDLRQAYQALAVALRKSNGD